MISNFEFADQLIKIFSEAGLQVSFDGGKHLLAVERPEAQPKAESEIFELAPRISRRTRNVEGGAPRVMLETVESCL